MRFMNNEYETISSEIKDLEGLISSVPPANVIDKVSLESRLRRANNILSHLLSSLSNDICSGNNQAKVP